MRHVHNGTGSIGAGVVAAALAPGLALLLAGALLGCGGSTGSNGGGDAGTTSAGMAGATPAGSGGSGVGGTGGAGGAASAGGVGGAGGVSLAGGAGAGGTATSGAGGSAGSNPAACAVEPTHEVSSAIATVGIVTFTTTLPSPASARIEFGLTTSYGMTAPVDLAEPNYRTLLLGMKQNREYHYRVVVESGGRECASADRTLMTGSLLNILPSIDVQNFVPEALAGGFFMTGQYQAQGGSNSPAYILDGDGDFVWAIAVGNYVTGVRMSYDGKYMWINGTNNTVSGQAHIRRVSMDGLSTEDLSAEFGFQDHQITILPDETVVFYGHDKPCPDIKQRFADGRIETIVNAQEAHGAEGMCHVNHIEYSPEDDTLIFSDDLHNNYTKVTRSGEVVWVLGGETNDFTGDGATWSRQHGVDVLGVDRLLYFNNGDMSGAESSRAIELKLDLAAMTATRTWTYTPVPPLSNQVLGDVQRLPNGNSVIAFSAQGIVHEVDAQGTLLQEISWPIGGAFGYFHKRPTLYGPPPR